MSETQIITQEQRDKVLVNCYKIGALSSAISDITEGEDNEASNLADVIVDYNLKSIQTLNNEDIAKAEGEEAPEAGKSPGIVEDAFINFTWAYQRLQPIPSMRDEEILESNGEAIDILADMAEKGLEYLEAGIRLLGHGYSNLHSPLKEEAPEAQPESTTSEAPE